MNLNNIQNKSLNDEFLSREEAKDILNYPEDKLIDILDIVYPIRKKYKGNKVSIQILTNAKSGDCSQDCKYCAQSCKSKADIAKYSMVDYDKLFNDAKLGQLKNVERHCVGFSGLRFTDDQINIICEYFLKLKNSVKTDICCSIGFLTEKQAVQLKNSGVNRINHNLNTGKNNYKNICSTHEYNERLENIKMLQKVGFEICCGGIIGLGETDDDIIDMFFDIKNIAPKSVPINFLIPIKGTELYNNDISKLTPEYCIKVLSLARLLNPKADIRCAAGRELYIKDKQNLMFKVVNSIFASGYLTAGGQSVEDTINLIKNSGFEYKIE